MSEREDFLNWLRYHAPEGKLYLLAINAKTKKSQRLFADSVNGNLSAWVDSRLETHHIYVGMATYREENATKANAVPSRLVWLDHDGPDADPFNWQPAPHHLWRTSDGRYQAAWVMEDFLPIPETEAISKSLAQKFGADISGWDITQLLRLPGTFNHKHEPGFPVAVVWKREPPGTPPYTPAELHTSAPLTGEAPALTGAAPEPASRDMAIYLLGKYDLPTTLVAETFLNEQIDRSTALFKLMANMYEHGASLIDVYRVAYHSANQKFDTPARLWEDVHRARNRTPTRKAKWVLHPASDLEFVSDETNWIINPFLYADCVGTIVGEPSARKSWNALHLAAAVAMKEITSFLNQPVEDHGPVIYFNLDDARSRRLKKRLGNILEAHTGDRDFKIPLWWVDGGFNYTEEGWERTLKENLDDVAQITGERCRLAIFDTLHRAGFDPKDWGINAQSFLNGLNGMAVEQNTAFIVVHHTAKRRETQSNNIRTAPWGSTFTGASLDPTWLLTRDYREDREDEDNIHVICEVWSKEGPEAQPLMLTYGKDPNKFEIVVGDADIKSRIVMELKRLIQPITQAELARRLGVDTEMLRRSITELEEAGKIWTNKSASKKMVALPPDEESEF